MITETCARIRALVRECGRDEYDLLMATLPLTSRERAAVWMWRDGLSVKETAEALSTGAENVKRIRRSAVEKIERYLSTTTRRDVLEIHERYTTRTRPLH